MYSRFLFPRAQVHEEVLRLLLAAAPMLAAAQLGEYLKLTLENSRKSRRRVKKHMLSSTGDFSVRLSLGLLLPHRFHILMKEWGALFVKLDFLQVVLNAEVGGSDIGSDGWAGIMALKNKNSDAVRSVYAKFKTVRLQVCVLNNTYLFCSLKID